MPLRRKKRVERRQVRRGAAPQPIRYKMTQKMVSIGQDFHIENAQGQRVYYVDGKALRIRDTLIFKDMQGNEVAHIQAKLLRIKDTMNISRGGQVIAKVKKALITPLRDRWTVHVTGGADLPIKGSILDHEYRMESGGQKVATVSKKWFRIRDSYGVEIVPGQDDTLILAATVAIDMMAHPGR